MARAALRTETTSGEIGMCLPLYELQDAVTLQMALDALNHCLSVQRFALAKLAYLNIFTGLRPCSARATTCVHGVAETD